MVAKFGHFTGIGDITYLILSAQQSIASGNIDSILNHKSNHELVFSHQKCGTDGLFMRASS